MFNTDSLNMSQTVFALFYAIVWGTLANAWPRWRAFDLSLAKNKEERPSIFWRWLLSFFLLNICPMLLFILIFIVLRGWQLCGQNMIIAGKLLVIMLQSLTLVGIYWIWIGILQTYRSKFYPANLDGQIYHNLCEEQDLNQKYAEINFLGGLGYLVFPLSLLAFLTWLSSDP